MLDKKTSLLHMIADMADVKADSGKLNLMAELYDLALQDPGLSIKEISEKIRAVASDRIKHTSNVAELSIVLTNDEKLIAGSRGDPMTLVKIIAKIIERDAALGSIIKLGFLLAETVNAEEKMEKAVAIIKSTSLKRTDVN